MRNELKSLILAAAVAGCGGDDGREETASATNGVTTPGISTTLTTGDSVPTTSEGSGSGNDNGQECVAVWLWEQTPC